MSDSPSPKYAAFISYRHVEPDRTWAKRLHTLLETYRTPKSLVRTGTPAKLGRVFRDEEELAASADLSAEINTALEQSAYLIVVCSPNTPQSKWVNAEVTRFRELGRHDRILALLIDGQPSDSFPPALCELRRTEPIEGTPTERVEIVEPLAADVRPRAGASASEIRTIAQLRFAATLLGVPYDDLRQRDLQRRLRNARWVAGLTVTLSVVFLGLVLLAWQQRQTAVRNEKEAVTTLARSNYFLADARWKENRVAEAFELLDAVPVEHRNIEWHLARKQFAGSDMTLYGHSEYINSIAISPDGSCLASASFDNTIKVWDLRTGAELRTLTGHDMVFSVTYTPDGTCIASASADRSLKLWNARTGAEIRTIEGQSRNPKNVSLCVAFSPDSTQLALGDDNNIKLRDVRTGTELHTLEGHTHFVNRVAFSPDGSRLVSASEDKTLKLWDVRTGAELCTLSEHRGIQSVAFSPDGTCIASGIGDGTVKLWDTRTRAELRTFSGHSDFVDCVAFSPDGSRIASGSRDKTIKLWDRVTGTTLHTFIGHQSELAAVAFSLDGGRVVSTSRDYTIKIWDARTGSPFRTLTQSRSVTNVATSPDGTQIASVVGGNTIDIWDARAGTVLRTLACMSNVTGVAFSPDSTCFAAAHGSVITLWDALTGAELGSLSDDLNPKSERVVGVSFGPNGAVIASGGTRIRLWDRHRRIVTDELGTSDGTRFLESDKFIAFSPDGTQIAAVSSFDEFKVWDTLTGTELRTLWHEYGQCVAFNPDGTRVATGGKNLKSWDARTGAERRIFKSYDDSVRALAFSPDGTRVASNWGDGTIRLLDAETGEELRSYSDLGRGPPRHDRVGFVAFGADGTRIASASGDTITMLEAPKTSEVRSLWHYGKVDRLTFSPDGTHIASVSLERTIKLWDLFTGSELLTISGHKGIVTSVAFSPDGTRIASGSMDKTIKLWEVRTGSELLSISGHNQLVTSVAFSPDGTRIASGGGNTIKLWDAGTGSELLALNAHDDVGILAFSSDGTRLLGRDIGRNRFSWNLRTGTFEAARSDHVIDATQYKSLDGKLLAVRSANQILLVDLTFKHDPDEKAYREFKAKPDPWWHEEQAFAAEQEGAGRNWYAAVFHLAWLLKIRPEDADAHERLHRAYEAYKTEYQAQLADPANAETLPEGVTPRSTNPDDYLPAVVRESLKLPRGTGPALRKREP